MPLPPETIGRIIFSRFLSLPLLKCEAVLDEVEALLLEQPPATRISFRPFLGALVAENEHLPPDVLAKIEYREGRFLPAYRRKGFAGEYLLGPYEPKGFHLAPLERKLRLINSRNKLTHAMLQGLLANQADFLQSADPRKLKPLSQAQLVRWMIGHGYTSVDPSMISRVSAGLFLVLPWGQAIPLRGLLPSRKTVIEGMIQALLEEEATQVCKGLMSRPYSDEAIRSQLEERFGLSVSRRWVSKLRGLMGMPSSKRRYSGRQYPPQWTQFSPHSSFTPSALKAVPEVPGVYELRVEDSSILYPHGVTGIFYIGGTANLRRRLKAHRAANHQNQKLARWLSEHECLFRFFPCRGWREAERELLRCFAEAYGSRPACNRVG